MKYGFLRMTHVSVFLGMCAFGVGTTGTLQAETAPQAHYSLLSYGESDEALMDAFAQYQDGKYAVARPVLENALESLTDFEGRHSLAYILADIAMESGDPNGAERYLRKAAQYPPLMSLSFSRLGDLLLTRGDQEGGLDALAAVRPGSPQYPQARYQRARVLLKRNQLSEALEDAEDAAMEATSDRDREKARLLLVDVMVAQERNDEAIRALEQLWWERPRSEEGVLSRLKDLQATPGPEANMLRDLDAISRYSAGKREKDLRKRLKKFKKRSQRGLKTLGNGWIKMHIRGQRSEAPEIMQKAVKETVNNPLLAPWARLGEALALRKVNRDLEAAESYLQLIETFPEHHLVPRALQGAGELLIRNELPLEGERALRSLIGEYPNAKERPRALWELAWSDYLGGNYGRSISFLDQLMRSHPTEKAPSGGFWRERALYWRGKCLSSMGNVEEGDKSYRKVLMGYPLGYYALQALNRMREHLDEVELPGMSRGEENQGSALPEIRRNSTLDTAVELVRAGLLGAARRELQARLRGGEFHGDGLSLLLWIHQREKNPRRARAAMRKYSRVGAYPSPGTMDLWKEAYPVDYEELVHKNAKRNGLSPYLILGLIRQESHFDRKARSYAYALGLMQLLAPVARSIAVKLLDYKRLAARDLYKPAINIEIGTRMLSELHRMYRGNTILAVASYNAGPYAVKDWVHRFGHLETDELVEVIPYRGTASYVKKVLGAASVFGALYGPEGKWDIELDNVVPSTLGPYMKRKTDT